MLNVHCSLFNVLQNVQCSVRCLSVSGPAHLPSFNIKCSMFDRTCSMKCVSVSGPPATFWYQMFNVWSKMFNAQCSVEQCVSVSGPLPAHLPPPAAHFPQIAAIYLFATLSHTTNHPPVNQQINLFSTVPTACGWDDPLDLLQQTSNSFCTFLGTSWYLRISLHISVFCVSISRTYPGELVSRSVTHTFRFSLCRLGCTK